MRLATASIVVALTLVAASPGQAAVITLQALNAAQGGEFSNLGPTNQQAADDFVLAATTSLDSFSWFGRYFANIAVADPVDFSIRIFADIGGQPAAAALHTFGVSVNASPTGLDFGGVPWFSVLDSTGRDADRRHLLDLGPRERRGDTHRRKLSVAVGRQHRRPSGDP